MLEGAKVPDEFDVMQWARAMTRCAKIKRAHLAATPATPATREAKKSNSPKWPPASARYPHLNSPQSKRQKNGFAKKGPPSPPSPRHPADNTIGQVKRHKMTGTIAVHNIEGI